MFSRQKARAEPFFPPRKVVAESGKKYGYSYLFRLWDEFGVPVLHFYLETFYILHSSSEKVMSGVKISTEEKNIYCYVIARWQDPGIS